MRLATMFERDYARYEGVRPFNIQLLRLVFLLVFLAIGFSSWSKILNHEGPWDHLHALAYCVLGTYSLMSLMGVLHPLKMLPLMLFMIVYKLLWLAIVAYPLWSSGQLYGSPAEPMTRAFLWVILFIVAVPWGYAFQKYVLTTAQHANGVMHAPREDARA